MGAWSTGIFDNDSAMDWIYEFSDNPSLQVLHTTFENIINNDDFIDSDDGSAALVAAEVLAAILGKKSAEYPEDIEVFTKLIPDPNLVNKGLLAISRVAESNQSELKQLWQESGDDLDWQNQIKDLQKRLLL
jgi:Domain of unknown function (DUF4259)